MIEIKNRFNGNIIISGEYDSLIVALEKNRSANLCSADLSFADLSSAIGIKIPIISIFGTRHVI